MFNLTYYFDATYYKPGGPVIVLNGGETSVAGRLPYLQKGIVAQLAQATGGVGVILEHRYYGTSFPTEDLSTESLRFLTTEQALADQAYFSQNIVFPGLEDLNLTAPGTAHIAYGGSYAGAFVAFLRIQYPDIYWGAISSSGVTEAIWDFWEYFEAIRNYAPADCVQAQVRMINITDNVLMSGDNETIDNFKSAFNASGFTYNDDFANTLSSTMGYWQGRNWDPAVDDPTFFQYCGNITNDTVLFDNQNLTTSVQGYIEAAGWGKESSTLTNQMLNWIGWSKAAYMDSCASTLDDCYGSHNASASKYADKSLDNYDALSWNYQVCTEWGFLQSGSTVPEDLLPLVSRLVSIPYNMLPCNYAFNITGPPDTDRVNKYGGFNISYPRLAIIGGEADPWRAASPLATLNVPDRLNVTSTVDQPIILIQGAVHHWDENGLFANETTADLPPAPVRDAQIEIAQAVQSWMAEWSSNCMANYGSCNN